MTLSKEVLENKPILWKLQINIGIRSIKTTYAILDIYQKFTREECSPENFPSMKD